MFRSLLPALAVAGLALAGPAQARAADLPSAASCGGWALQAGLGTQVCATVTGTTVSFTGTVGLAGPPSPGTRPQPQQLDTALTAQVTGASPVELRQGVLFTASTVPVGPLTVTAPCGSTAHATFTVTAYPWASAPVTVDVPVVC